MPHQHEGKTDLPAEIREVHLELAKFAGSLGWSISAVYIRKVSENHLQLIPVVPNCPTLADVLTHFEGLVALMEKSDMTASATSHVDTRKKGPDA